jgi:uncharacterized paraquat-inducible protein A
MIYLKLQVFIKSLLFHIYNGFPKSTKDEIIYRYGICKTCEYFDAQKSQCGVCGCYLSTKKQFLNKLAWADQSCPKDKWSFIRKN